jgi:hypothetical protein
MTDQSLIDRVALALVQQMLSLSGQIKGKHYTDEPRAFVVAVRGEDRRVGYEEAEALSPHWQSMAEAAIVAMTSGTDEQPEVGVLGTTSCNECHSVFQGKIPIPCPACIQLREVRLMIAAREVGDVELIECSNCKAVYRLSRAQRTSFHCPNCKRPDGLSRKVGISRS